MCLSNLEPVSIAIFVGIKTTTTTTKNKLGFIEWAISKNKQKFKKLIVIK